MKIKPFVATLLLLLSFWTLTPLSTVFGKDKKTSALNSARSKQDAIEIKSGVAQLFADDFLIETQINLARSLHQPKKDNGGNFPVLALDTEYGQTNATLEANGSIVFDSRLKNYVMFAIAFSSELSGEDRVRMPLLEPQ